MMMMVMKMKVDPLIFSLVLPAYFLQRHFHWNKMENWMGGTTGGVDVEIGMMVHSFTHTHFFTVN